MTSGTVTLYLRGAKVTSKTYNCKTARQEIIDYWKELFTDMSEMEIGIIPDVTERRSEDRILKNVARNEMAVLRKLDQHYLKAS